MTWIWGWVSGWSWAKVTVCEKTHFSFNTSRVTPFGGGGSCRHLRLDDAVAPIERRLAVFVPPMAAAAFAALKLLTQFGDLGGWGGVDR